MTNVPQTMTDAGLAFLSGLAGKAGTGVILEVGPLFGSSTNAIDRGRKDSTTPIHTIDTFEAAPWVRERLGIDLSRQMFDKFTSHIPNLHVHEGFAPDVVLKTWSEKIGFYFDDATHGDPGWTNNYAFFSKFFSDDAIICGDDFAGGWPDIIRNVYKISEEFGVRLFVIGRVWALARQNDARIQDVVDSIFPTLKGMTTISRNGDALNEMTSACWSWGLHRQIPMTGLGVKSEGSGQGQIVGYANGKVVGTIKFDGEILDLSGVDQIYVSNDRGLKVQYCTVNERGKTGNSKAIKSGTLFTVPRNERIVAVRFSS
jgi:hypothetical protein